MRFFRIDLEGFALGSHFFRFLGTAVEDDLDGTRYRIRDQTADLVFSTAIIRHLRMIPLQMDRIEFTAGRAQTAADASVFIDDVDAAGQTS